jgi:hypothetical protein
MAEVVNVIWAENEPEYFCNDHWTGQISLIRQKKLDFRRDAMDQPWRSRPIDLQACNVIV